MPELPEVETIVRGLEPDLVDRLVTAARLRRRTLYRRGSQPVRDLTRRTIRSVGRVGKNAVFHFEPRATMVVNLGMTGWLAVCGIRERLPGHPGCHLHGRLRLDDGRELRYYDPRRFGFIYITESQDIAKALNLGPDPFEAGPRHLGRVLEGRRALTKALLLDQRLVSGLGNIYADEALYYAGVDPRTPGDEAAGRAAAILKAARTVLRRAIAYGGSTVRDYRRHDGTAGGFQLHHAVYGREGEPCLCCGRPIRKIIISGRGTHFCPACQT